MLRSLLFLAALLYQNTVPTKYAFTTVSPVSCNAAAASPPPNSISIDTSTDTTIDTSIDTAVEHAVDTATEMWNRGEHMQSIDLFNDIALEHPGSPLPHFYLGAIHQFGTGDDSDNFVSEEVREEEEHYFVLFHNLY